MATTVQRWGNSLAIRIPKAFALEAGLAEDAEVEIGVRGGNLIVRPARKDWSLTGLLSGIRPSNLHTETKWSHPAGREAW